MGLGLKRGWQAIMDTCYAIDNMYHSGCFQEKLGLSDDDMTWDDHFDALREQANMNFELCNRLQVGEELALGEYEDKSLIMTQLKKRMKDPEKPMLLVEIDPWTRYKPLADEVAASIRMMPKEEKDKFIHPIVLKAVAMKEYYNEVSSAGGKGGDIEYRGKELVSINGRVPPGKGKGKDAASASGGKKKAVGAGKAPASRRGKKAAAAPAPEG